MNTVVVAAIAACAAWLATPPVTLVPRADLLAAGLGSPDRAAGQTAPPGSGRSSSTAVHGVVAVAAASAGWTFVGGVPGAVAALVTGIGSWRVLRAAEPRAVRREREAVARELPHVIDLFAATLRSGADPVAALDVVASALPGPSAERLRPALAHARMGVPPGQVWDTVARDPLLSRLGTTLQRSSVTGAPVVRAVEQLADELDHAAAADAEDAARRVGVLAALPLGACLLPAFLLIGIVPVVAGLLSSLAG